MTLEVKHQFESEVADGDDDTVVQPSDWNATHNLTMATGRILGRTTEDAGAVEELTASDVRTFLNVEDGADVTDATNVGTAGAFMKSSDDSDDITEGSTKLLMTTTERTKVGHLTVTQAVDLDAMESKLAGIEESADVTDATNVASAGAFMKSVDDSDDITEGSTKLFLTSAERTRLGQLETGDSPQFAGIELGHASANTLSAASGVLSIEGKALAYREPTINPQTGTTYTLALSDGGCEVTMDNESSNAVTIPANSSIAFPVGTVLAVTQIGAGVTTVDGDTGVTVNGTSGGGAAILARYQGVSLRKTATDTWVMSGAHGTVA